MTQPAPTCRDWPAGTRVRCVDALGRRKLVQGRDYTVRICDDDGTLQVDDDDVTWYATTRFTLVNDEWPVGTRVRYIGPEKSWRGREMTVRDHRGITVALMETSFTFPTSSWKPVVRVPMGRREDADPAALIESIKAEITARIRRDIAALDVPRAVQNALRRSIRC